MSDTEYRYVAARGVEKLERLVGRERWEPVDDLSALPAAELRKIADAMDGSPRIHGTAASAAAESLVGASSEEGAAGTTACVNTRLLNGAYARIRDLEAQVESARKANDGLRNAVNATADAALVTDEEIRNAFQRAWNTPVPFGSGLTLETLVVKEMRPLIDRAARAGAPDTPTHAADAAQVTGDTVRTTPEQMASDLASGKASLTYAASDEEAAAIARLRERIATNVWLRDGDVSKVLAALDRATAERDGWEKDARNLAMAHHDAHKRIRDLEAQVAHYRLSWESAERTINLLRADLRAQLAARTDAKPLAWVNVYQDCVSAWNTEAKAKEVASPRAIGVAVPVYEHAPRPVAPVSDLDIIRALEGVFDMHQESILARQCVTALRPLFDRAAASAPALQVVGACVMREGYVEVFSRSSFGNQREAEAAADRTSKTHGGTAHRLYAGERIGGGE